MSQQFPATEEEERYWKEVLSPAKGSLSHASDSRGLFGNDHTITAGYGDYSTPAKPAAPQAKKDAVNPDHYKRGGIECIDGIRAALTEEEFRGYCKGSAMAYLWRDGKKDDPIQEAGKANWYVAWLQGKDPRK
jgi:hypothetical protein